jgi:hypothetical protein
MFEVNKAAAALSDNLRDYPQRVALAELVKALRESK